jgi:hypothetical protein
MSPVFATAGGEGHLAERDPEQGGVFGRGAVVIDIIVDRETRIGVEIERGRVVEGDAERRVGRCLQDVVLVDVVLHMQRCRNLVAGNRGFALQRRDVADRFGRRWIRGCRRLRWLCARLRHGGRAGKSGKTDGKSDGGIELTVCHNGSVSAGALHQTSIGLAKHE